MRIAGGDREAETADANHDSDIAFTVSIDRIQDPHSLRTRSHRK